MHPCACCNAFQQIHRRNHSTPFFIFFLERGQGRSCACSPEPRGVGRIFPILLSLNIQRMERQDFITLFHHFPQHGFFRKIISYPSCENIMRRRQLHHLSLLLYQQMTVAGSHIKFIALPGQTFLQGIHKNRGIFCTDFTRTVIRDDSVLICILFFCQSYKITPKGHI